MTQPPAVPLRHYHAISLIIPQSLKNSSAPHWNSGADSSLPHSSGGVCRGPKGCVSGKPDGVDDSPFAAQAGQRRAMMKQVPAGTGAQTNGGRSDSGGRAGGVLWGRGEAAYTRAGTETERIHCLITPPTSFQAAKSLPYSPMCSTKDWIITAITDAGSHVRLFPGFGNNVTGYSPVSAPTLSLTSRIRNKCVTVSIQTHHNHANINGLGKDEKPGSSTLHRSWITIELRWRRNGACRSTPIRTALSGMCRRSRAHRQESIRNHWQTAQTGQTGARGPGERVWATGETAHRHRPPPYADTTLAVRPTS